VLALPERLVPILFKRKRSFMFENGTGEAMDYVAYYRVSTAGQARSGLGLAAQQEIVSRFLKPGDQATG
jgi:hypothetical protein